MPSLFSGCVREGRPVRPRGLGPHVAVPLRPRVAAQSRGREVGRGRGRRPRGGRRLLLPRRVPALPAAGHAAAAGRRRRHRHAAHPGGLGSLHEGESDNE